MRPLTCPTCGAALTADLGHGLVACPYCNSAIDRGPAGLEAEDPFRSGPSPFLPSQHDKPLGAPASGWGAPRPIRPLDPGGARSYGPAPTSLLQPPASPRTGGSVGLIVVVVVLIGLGVVALGLLPLFFLLLG